MNIRTITMEFQNFCRAHRLGIMSEVLKGMKIKFGRKQLN
jgi:hypothetical protein